MYSLRMHRWQRKRPSGGVDRTESSGDFEPQDEQTSAETRRETVSALDAVSLSDVCSGLRVPSTDIEHHCMPLVVIPTVEAGPHTVVEARQRPRHFASKRLTPVASLCTTPRRQRPPPVRTTVGCPGRRSGWRE
jgi:hypothetical protein